MTAIKGKTELCVFYPRPDVEVLFLTGSFPTLTLQREAVISLLERKFGIPVSVSHDSYGRPSLPPGFPTVSMTHCRSAVAVALSCRFAVGIDVEGYSVRLDRVASRFLNPKEHLFFSTSPVTLLRAWTFKEAAFKMLQFLPDPPAVITKIPLSNPAMASVTWHLGNLALTVVWNKTV